MVQRTLHRYPRHFSPDRLTTTAKRRLRGLSLTVDDIQYAFTYGKRLRRGRYTAVVLRRRDIPPTARRLEAIVRRDGIVLLLDRRGLIRDVWRDE